MFLVQHGPRNAQVLWAKGYTELLDRMNEHMQRTGERVPVDVYGAGPDLPVRYTSTSCRTHLTCSAGPHLPMCCCVHTYVLVCAWVVLIGWGNSSQGHGAS